ncbi:two-component regulator propeller domain-containing protein [Flavicella sp.]
METFKHRDGFVHSLSNNVIRCVYEDKEGVIWGKTHNYFPCSGNRL